MDDNIPESYQELTRYYLSDDELAERVPDYDEERDVMEGFSDFVDETTPAFA